MTAKTEHPDRNSAYAPSLPSDAAGPALGRRGARELALGFGTYAVLVVTLVATGAYAAIDTNFFTLTVIAATLALVAGYFASPAIRALAARLGPHGLAYFHVWRIPAGLAFLHYGAQSWLPETFTQRAGWGDVVAGGLAALLLLLPRSTKLVTGFHLVGFADLVLAVGTGIALTALAPASMGNIATLPIALIPLIGVPISAASHVAAFDLLRRGAVRS